MSFLMVLRVAFKALARNKMRTSLTMLGMIIGVAAVITMVALGAGAQASIADQIKGPGTNTVTVFPGSANTGGVQTGAGGSSKLVAADAESLRELPIVAYVAEGIQSRQQMVYGNQNWSSTVVGTNIDFTQVKSWPMQSGSFFSDQDVKSAAKVVCLGTNVAEMLFGDVDPVGETIRIKNQPFKVIGIMAQKGSSSSGQNQDDQVFIPWTTLTKKIQRSDNLQYIITSTVSADDVKEAQKEITAALRLTSKLTANYPDDFQAKTEEDWATVPPARYRRRSGACRNCGPRWSCCRRRPVPRPSCSAASAPARTRPSTPRGIRASPACCCSMAWPIARRVIGLVTCCRGFSTRRSFAACCGARPRMPRAWMTIVTSRRRRRRGRR